MYFYNWFWQISAFVKIYLDNFKAILVLELNDCEQQ